jgi:hypothetical protein
VGGIPVSNIDVVVEERTRRSASRWPRRPEAVIRIQFFLNVLITGAGGLINS